LLNHVKTFSGLSSIREMTEETEESTDWTAELRVFYTQLHSQRRVLTGRQSFVCFILNSIPELQSIVFKEEFHICSSIVILSVGHKECIWQAP
jgi:hypothetical protein